MNAKMKKIFEDAVSELFKTEMFFSYKGAAEWGFEARDRIAQEREEKQNEIIQELMAGLDDCVDGLEGHFGAEFWESPLGVALKPKLESVKEKMENI